MSLHRGGEEASQPHLCSQAYWVMPVQFVQLQVISHLDEAAILVCQVWALNERLPISALS